MGRIIHDRLYMYYNNVTMPLELEVGSGLVDRCESYWRKENILNKFLNTYLYMMYIGVHWMR